MQHIRVAICAWIDPPEEARELRTVMRIEDGYLAAIADDLTDEQAEDRVAELQRLCEGILGV